MLLVAMLTTVGAATAQQPPSKEVASPVGGPLTAFEKAQLKEKAAESRRRREAVFQKFKRLDSFS